MKKGQKSMLVLGIVTAFTVTVLFLPGLARAGDLEPPGPPTTVTMKTLNEIPPTWSQILPADDGDPDECNCSRFKCVMEGEAVLDKETGLVWAKDANIAAGTKTWVEAMRFCQNLVIGHRKGWRLPTINEMASLVGTSNSTPALPSVHPFDNVQSSYYWTSSRRTAPDAISAWLVRMHSGFVFNVFKGGSYYVWPVLDGNL